MKASVISTFLLLATATRIQKANGASSGEEQLREAAESNNVDLVKSLLDGGVDAKATNDYGKSALMLAAGVGNDKAVELLLPKSDVKATDNDGWSALMLAAGFGNDKVVELLLPKSDAKATDKWTGYSALMIAARKGNSSSVELLLPFSDVEATNNRGKTAADLAKVVGHNQIVRLIQQYSN